MQGDAVALGELAASYWYAVYVWWRRSGLEAEAAGAAGAATVASFTRWMTTHPPGAEDSGAGLMREWLPGRLAELAVEGLEVEGEPAIEIETEWAEGYYASEPEGEPDAVFHRRWTLTVLEFAMQALRAEYAARELDTLFAEVAPFVGFEGVDETRYAAAAERAGMSVGALRRAVFEFRTQHRAMLRSIVADTVADLADLGGEITALLCACDLADAGAGAPAPLPTAIRTFKPDELLARAMNTVQMTSGGTGKWQPPSDAEVARLFPQFEMRGMIGRGGMGAVYRARQVALDRDVAIKILPLEVSVDQAFADRFVREARAMAKLNHPNIIAVYGFGTTAEGHLYFFMEYVEGANVSQIIRGPGLEPEQALVITEQVCTALAYAHGKGVIHRDIKPANVMVGTDGAAKVADFGLARVDGADPSQYGQTVTGTIMGTAEYMAPEQKRGMGVDHRADIYSVGAMLYEMLCKEPPHGAIEPPSQRTGCDARLDQIVLKAMSRLPEGRYQSAAEMQQDIEAARTPLPAAPPRQVPAPRMNAGANRLPIPPPEKSSSGLLVIIVLVALVGGAVFLLNRKEPPSDRPVAQAPKAIAPALPSTPGPANPPIPAVAGKPEIMPEEVPRPPENPPNPAVAVKPEPMKEETPRPPENPPASPPVVLSGPKDLLAGVDVARDAVKGQWQMTPEGLLVKTVGGREFELLGFNCDPPEEYDFEIEFTIPDGNREVSLALPIAGRTVLWKMGCHPTGAGQGYFSFGHTLDGLPPPAAARTEAVVRLPLLNLNQRYRCLVEVRRNSFRAVLDGKEVLRWSGDFQRFGSEAEFTLPNVRRLGVAAWSTSVLFHKAEVRPLPRTNLLANVDVARDAVKGQWQMTPEGLLAKSPGHPGFDLLGFNYVPPEEYDFEIEFTIQDGNREVNQALPVAGRNVLWKMGCYITRNGADGYLCFGQTLDGLQPNAKERTEATVFRPLLKLNQRYRSVVEVRRGSLRALLDGKEVLRWSGDFQRFGEETGFELPNPRQLGLATCWTSVLFHKAEVRLPGTITRLAVAAAPAASALVAASNDARLVKLEAAFQARFESDAQKPYLAAIAALDQSYLANGVARARAAAQAKGSLAEVIALDDEKATIEKGGGLPAGDDEGTPDALKTLRATYRAAMTKYNAERAKTGAPLYDLYLASINGYEAELTRAGKIDAALKVRALREEVAAKKAELTHPAVEPPKPAAAPAPAAPEPKTSATTNVREAVKSLLASGGSCRIARGALETDVLTEQELPVDKFEIIGLTLDRRQWKGAPPTDADAKIFRGIKTLRTIWAYTPELGNAGFAFLDDNADLTTAHIHTDSNRVTDGVLQHLASSEKLTDLSVLYANNFTGKGLKKMRWLPLLTKADFHGSGISNEGLKELAGATMLTDLNLELCSGITDAGLAKLTTLTRLQTLNVRDTGVSPAGIEAFKKALPKCQVTK